MVHNVNFNSLSVYAGKVLHSHSYKYAEPFSGQSVVVLGARASGLDISNELAKAGAQVTNNTLQLCLIYVTTSQLTLFSGHCAK